PPSPTRGEGDPVALLESRRLVTRARQSYAAGAAGLAAASACALRSLRGTAFSGLLRFSRFLTPAASRKRITRSEGCAPLASHDLTLSMSSLSRFSSSLGSSGLK